MITTQNPGDFAITGEAARKSEAIIENCQYSIFFNLKSNDINKINNLYKMSTVFLRRKNLLLIWPKLENFYWQLIVLTGLN
ncbi:hypothetical protein [Mesomycoplasma hyopneumoniae]|uniref:hypothetical protein n=1 Tax=Mesomycoplasma hyopneumoniae TaxID=2099 RepID=UPI001E6546A2|nr:hypothetical protein [Mesomycoplasma hyopneumoniae]